MSVWSFCFNFLVFIWKAERRTPRETLLPFPSARIQLGLSQDETSNQKFSLRLWCGWEGPKRSGITWCFPQMTETKLEMKTWLKFRHYNAGCFKWCITTTTYWFIWKAEWHYLSIYLIWGVLMPHYHSPMVAMACAAPGQSQELWGLPHGWQGSIHLSHLFSVFPDDQLGVASEVKQLVA